MKNTVSYRKVNAFTANGSLGNPAAYLDARGLSLSDEQMLSVGKEHAGFVSEVVFVFDSERADLKLIYFSSECEVEFCGHGTIATMYNMIASTPTLRQRPLITFETNRKGILTVYNRIESEDAVYITAPEQYQLSVPVEAQQIADILGVSPSALDSNYPLDYIEAGLRTLIVPVRSLAEEISVWPDEAALREFNYRYGIEDFLIFSMETADAKFFAHTRVFAPKFGYLEDPATGSANSAFARYLLKHKLWDGSPICLEQGGDDRMFNTVKITQENGQILFGGCASVKIEGEYYL